jgi:hypothetical protein
MIQIELIKLATGVRLLQFTEPRSGLALERTLDPKVPVSAQKEALAKVFQAALIRRSKHLPEQKSIANRTGKWNRAR